jgi:hypothetical protein
MFMVFFYLGEPRWVAIDVDGFAAEVGDIVLEKELPFLQGTFGLLFVIVAKYWILPLLGILLFFFQGMVGMPLPSPLPQQLQLNPTTWSSCSCSK